MRDEEESNLTIDKHGNKRWINRIGFLHRIDGPAVERNDGGKEWYINGKLHRIDGPAVDWGNGAKTWYLAGRYYPSKEAFFNALTDKEKEIALFSEDFHNA